MALTKEQEALLGVFKSDLLGDARLNKAASRWDAFDPGIPAARCAVELESLLTRCLALSPDNGGDGESEKCAALEGWLRAHGITQLAHYDAPDPRVTSGVRPNLVATIPGGRPGGAVWVCTHMDVVPPGDSALWESDPLKVREESGALYGRGVEDNQQGMCSAILAALAFVRRGLHPARTLRLLFMADEETGSAYGMEYLLSHHADIFGQRDRYLVPDGGDSEGRTIEVAEKGVLWLRFEVRGRGGHGSAPDACVNAKRVSDVLSTELYRVLHGRFDKGDPLFGTKSTFEPTMQEANDAESVNMIPSRDAFCYDCRVLPCYRLDEVLGAADEVAREIEQRFSTKIKIDVLQRTDASATSPASPVVRELSGVMRDIHGQQAEVIGIGGGTVAACLRRRGFDAVVWSTMENNAHKVNESALIENICKDALTIAMMAAIPGA